ncbi:hypothetical protein WA026_016986 [Henosepilachna vigintioctopunctata]|uniref:Uncharacterized protein n=1 Tax=Henosepilachna vigintioctopunctata TaxID=420089 RepID=A0AAW1U0F4_9CUCU
MCHPKRPCFIQERIDLSDAEGILDVFNIEYFEDSGSEVDMSEHESDLDEADSDKSETETESDMDVSDSEDPQVTGNEFIFLLKFVCFSVY